MGTDKGSLLEQITHHAPPWLVDIIYSDGPSTQIFNWPTPNVLFFKSCILVKYTYKCTQKQSDEKKEYLKKKRKKQLHNDLESKFLTFEDFGHQNQSRDTSGNNAEDDGEVFFIIMLSTELSQDSMRSVSCRNSRYIRAVSRTTRY